MLMRAVFASAMLIGLAGTAQAEIRIIYPPYSYKPPMNLCDYILGHYCGYRYTDGRYGYDVHYDHYGYPYPRYDAFVLPHEAYANTATVVVIQPPSIGEGSRHWNFRSHRSWKDHEASRDINGRPRHRNFRSHRSWKNHEASPGL